MVRSARAQALNFTAVAVGLLAFGVVVARPLYRLLHLGLRPHGGLEEDFEYYYGLVAVGVQTLGQYTGLMLCILGITLALSTTLGLRVRAEARARARFWFWILPAFCFGGEMMGRYLVQSWYGSHGLMFPSMLFIRETMPSLCWYGLALLLTSPAIRTGQGIYLLRWRYPPSRTKLST